MFRKCQDAMLQTAYAPMHQNRAKALEPRQGTRFALGHLNCVKEPEMREGTRFASGHQKCAKAPVLRFLRILELLKFLKLLRFQNSDSESKVHIISTSSFPWFIMQHPFVCVITLITYHTQYVCVDQSISHLKCAEKMESYLHSICSLEIRFEGAFPVSWRNFRSLAQF